MTILRICAFYSFDPITGSCFCHSQVLPFRMCWQNYHRKKGTYHLRLSAESPSPLPSPLLLHPLFLVSVLTIDRIIIQRYTKYVLPKPRPLHSTLEKNETNERTKSSIRMIQPTLACPSTSSNTAGNKEGGSDCVKKKIHCTFYIRYAEFEKEVGFRSQPMFPFM